MDPLSIIIVAIVAVTVAVTQGVILYQTIRHLQQTRTRPALITGIAVAAVMTTINIAVTAAQQTWFPLAVLPLTATVWVIMAAWLHDTIKTRNHTTS